MLVDNVTDHEDGVLVAEVGDVTQDLGAGGLEGLLETLGALEFQRSLDRVRALHAGGRGADEFQDAVA